MEILEGGHNDTRPDHVINNIMDFLKARFSVEKMKKTKNHVREKTFNPSTFIPLVDEKITKKQNSELYEKTQELRKKLSENLDVIER